ncbi:hypothetical protein GCM10008919_01190 [Selenomonas dianae]|uniref:Uncharacterized protein n=2 Tax=Selenomonas dianae TaxID=135079 RepID=A0ABN0SV00_9FIRM
MQLNRPSLLLLIHLLSFSAPLATAAPAQQEQLDQSRAQETERQERLGEERVETIVAPSTSADLPADESVRFHISQITIENQVERFRFLERIARPYKDKELSLSDINKFINAMILDSRSLHRSATSARCRMTDSKPYTHGRRGG